MSTSVAEQGVRRTSVSVGRERPALRFGGMGAPSEGEARRAHLRETSRRQDNALAYDKVLLAERDDLHACAERAADSLVYGRAAPESNTKESVLAAVLLRLDPAYWKALAQASYQSMNLGAPQGRISDSTSSRSGAECSSSDHDRTRPRAVR